MCYDDNAQPPLPPETSGTAKGEDLILQASDGNRFAAYIAYPEHPTGAQVLIFPDVRGLHQFYKDLALRFAETGTLALAIDYFGRTAGLTERNDTFEFWPHVQQLNTQNFFNDVKAAIVRLQHIDSSQPIFTIGFCLGGSFSLISATQDFGLGGAIGFYAGLSRVLPGSSGSVIELSTQTRYPVLGLFGGADPGIPLSDVQNLDENLDKAGVEHEIVTYPDAPHSFFDRRSADFAEASDDAWHRILNFISAHMPSQNI